MAKSLSSASMTREQKLFRLGKSLHDMIHAVDSARDQAARSENLHPTDFGCIGYLARAGSPVSPKQIIAHVGLSSGSGTALLDRLEVAGYIRRIPNPEDRRSVLIELDAERAAAPIKRYREIEESYRRATDALDEEQLAVIAGFLEHMTDLALGMNEL